MARPRAARQCTRSRPSASKKGGFGRPFFLWLCVLIRSTQDEHRHKDPLVALGGGSRSRSSALLRSCSGVGRRAAPSSGDLHVGHHPARGPADRDGCQFDSGDDHPRPDEDASCRKGAVRLQQSHRLAGFHGISLLASGDLDQLWSERRLHVHPPIRPHLVVSCLLPDGIRRCACPIRTVRTQQRRHHVSDYTQPGTSLRFRTGSNCRENWDPSWSWLDFTPPTLLQPCFLPAWPPIR